ncbi:ABC transporter ATP-binding protein [Vibrio scophthalmi]|uniref:ABC transporter ATP-binding protein n=1 Tax=Vibrio scophthalmi TaxID=45658 RepID=UPI0022840C1A|nr:ABC transporter ATP-binding protein [Vibrio scophthalmi]MCY9804042.1 ABC transporter ATP-binding protein [Vibrio scophthalmi]
MISVFYRLWCQLEQKRKSSFFILLCLMCISTVGELLSLAMLIPFMGVVLDPTSFKENEYIESAFRYANLDVEDNFLFYITMLFIFVASIAAVFRYILLVYNAKFTFSTSSEIATKMYRKVLSQPFESHMSLNSSHVIDGITQKVNATIYSGIQPFLSLLTSSIISISMFLFLLFVNVKVVLCSLAIFVVVYMSIAISLKNRIAILSRVFPEKSTLALKVVQEGLGNIRDIIIDKAECVYIRKYSELDAEYKNAQRDSMIYGGVPKLLIESLLMISIAYMLYYLSDNNVSLIELLPVFSVFIISAQKLLPLIQSIYASYTSMMSSKYAVLDVLNILEIDSRVKPCTKSDVLFTEKITLKNISFSYENSNSRAISDFCLTIRKGERLGVIGKTGCGKSTLIDILMGLLSQQEGEFYIDENELTSEKMSSWQTNIAHVPQSIYLSDSTIYENVGFGIDYDKINKEKVDSIINTVGLGELINDLPHGLDTIVGERGAKLSGGQRQRIGIARALYKNAEVLFLDEATSALDHKVEKSIIDVINSLEGITIIMIAHRIPTLSICNRIIELDKGKLINECIYSDLINV